MKGRLNREFSGSLAGRVPVLGLLLLLAIPGCVPNSPSPRRVVVHQLFLNENCASKPMYSRFMYVPVSPLSIAMNFLPWSS